MPDEYYARINELLSGGVPFVSVIVVDTAGSVPQDAGTKMIVTSSGLDFGTVGGGKVEKRAIQEAQAMLADDTAQRTRFVNWSLSKDIGMTCGGVVKLFFERYNVGVWQIAVFGAGHVANALIRLLLLLECRVTCIDPRAEWLSKLPDSAKLNKILADDLPSQVTTLDDNSFVLLMTMGHSTDSPVLIEILRTREFPFLGVIGSAAKAARLRQVIIQSGLPEAKTRQFFCPIGLPIGSNHPQEIALSITAQLLQERDAFFSRAPKLDQARPQPSRSPGTE